ncbi:MAG: hypothetical protein IJC12_02500 [Peptococcaceae bacterium]|nr:hypothetical protein [Peptococcaceae bacterium]
MKNNKTMIHSIIIIALVLGFGFLPPIGAVTPFGMKVLGGFLGCIYAYTVGIIMWPSLFVMFYLAFIQGTTFNAVIASAFGHQSVWMIAIALVFCAGLSKCGLLTTISQWLLSKKIIKKGPYYFLASIWGITWILGVITMAPIPTFIMMVQMAHELMEQVGVKKYSAYSNLLICGLAVFAYVGGSIFAFTGMTLIVFSTFISSGWTDTISYFNYTLYTLAVTVVFFASSLIITKFVLRPRIDFDITNLTLTSVKKLSLTQAQKIALICLAAVIVLLFLPSFLPAESAITSAINKIAFPGAAIIVAIVLSFTPKESGSKEHVMELDEEFKNSFNWNQIMLLATIFIFSSLLTSPTTGITDLLMSLTAPIFAGHSAFVTLLLLVLAACIVTNCLNNMVTVALLTPIAITYAGTAGLDVNLVLAAYGLIITQGCALPSGSAVGALLHSNTDLIKSKSIYGYASLYTLILAVMAVVVAWLMQGFIG